MSALISIRYFQNSTYHLSNPADTMKDYKTKMLIFKHYYFATERVTKIENIKTDSTKILRPTRQKILRPTVFSSVLLSKKEGE
jgi:hypothetical protein